MASRGDRQAEARQGSPRALLVVLAMAALLAGALFWQLNRDTPTPATAGAAPVATANPP